MGLLLGKRMVSLMRTMSAGIGEPLDTHPFPPPPPAPHKHTPVGMRNIIWIGRGVCAHFVFTPYMAGFLDGFHPLLQTTILGFMEYSAIL